MTCSFALPRSEAPTALPGQDAAPLALPAAEPPVPIAQSPTTEDERAAKIDRMERILGAGGDHARGR